ncbi:MAG: macrolide-efflux protein [Chloroflexi bacterium]|nr:macrolide-efflux protein [Chloroflexota bacterium]
MSPKEPVTTTPLSAPKQSPAPGMLRVVARAPTFAALRFREYRLIFGAQLGNSMVVNMDQVARGWLMYDLTGSTVQLGLVTSVKIVPGLLLAPIAGVMADRYDRRIQLIAAQSLSATMNLLLAILILTGLVAPWHLYATGLVVAIVQVFEIPARQSLLGESVDRAFLTNAIGLNSIVNNVCRSLGPAVAGGLIAVVGPGASYAVQGLIYVFSIMWTVQLRLASRASTMRVATGSIWAGTVEGWRYIGGNPAIRGSMTMLMLVAVFGTSFVAIFPALAKDVLNVDSTGQGLLVTGLGMGALVSAILLATHGDRVPKGKFMLAGGILFGIGQVAVGLSSWFAVSFALMVALGICSVTCTALINTVIQGHAAQHMRGRVMSMFQQGQVATTLGGLLIGALAAIVGVQWAIVIMGIGCVLGVIVVGLAMPEVRAIKQ